MAQQPPPPPHAVSALKALSNRIASTPPDRLPRAVSQLAASIWNSRSAFVEPAGPARQHGDAAAVVHRFRTQLSALLQDRTVGGRWAAVVLVKATLEAGGPDVLSRSNPWVRSLLGILKKPDPPTTRCLAIITLTRIFMLTWDYSNLVREITTPALPAFLSACLSNATNPRCSSGELQTVLESFITLIPHHPTIFRTNENQIRSLLARIISSSSSDEDSCESSQHIATAQRLLAILPYCTPKQGGADTWDQTFQATISSAHQTCDRIFRSVLEQWTSTAGVQSSAPTQQPLSTEPEQEGPDGLGLKEWSGVHAGAERLVSLLGLMQAHLTSPTPSTVTIRIGMLVDLLSRLWDFTLPQRGRQQFVQPNPHFGADERDALFAVLPEIHIRAFHLFLVMTQRLGTAVVPVVTHAIDRIVRVFEAESFHAGLRTAAYTVIKQCVQLIGPTLTKEEIADLTPVVTACCEDLLPADAARPHPPSQANTASSKKQHQAPDLVFQMNKAGPSNPPRQTELHAAASSLLPVLLSNLKPSHVPRKLRAHMDRTAILTRNKPALLAGVLNPAPNPCGHGLQPSLLPFLARLFPTDPEVEALLRPRMPAVRAAAHADGEGEGDEDPMSRDEDPMEQDDDMDHEIGQHGTVTDLHRTAEEPDLLTALDEHLTSAPPGQQDQAFSNTTPAADVPNTVPDSSASGSSTGKRTASDHAARDASAKRPRPSATAETLLPHTTAQLPGPDPAISRTDMPATVELEGESGEVGHESGERETVTVPHLPHPPHLPPPSAPPDATAEAEMGSDESDFELPPLTMEPDTEDEEEGDDGEDGEE